MTDNGPRRSARIAATGIALPERVLTNEDLSRMVDTSDEWILERTGIRERRIADAATAASDLAGLAAREAMHRAGVKADEIDAVLVASATPDMLLPCTACLVQKNLGLKNAVAFDVSAACSGWVFALTVGREYVAGGLYRRVLVIGTEVLSRIIDYTDRGTCVLFGDGAGAAVLVPCEEGRGILSYQLASDGTLGENLMVPAGGSRMPATHETVDQRLHYVKMVGNNVFKAAVRAMGDATLTAIQRAGLRPDQLDLLIPHQANRRIIEATAERLGVPMDRVFMNVQRYGNMSAASIPVALHEAVDEGRVKDGSLVGMVAFGGGFTWGAVVMRW